MELAFKLSVIAAFLMFTTTSVFAQSYVFSSNTYTELTDLILESDPSCFKQATFVKTNTVKMPADYEWDPETNTSPIKFRNPKAYIYTLVYDDGLSAQVHVDAQDFSRTEADKMVKDYGYKMGQLPACLRKGVPTINFLKGDSGITPFGEENAMTIQIGKFSKIHNSVDRMEEALMTKAAQLSLLSVFNQIQWEALHKKDQNWVSRNGTYYESDIAETFMGYVAVEFRRRRASVDYLKKIEEFIPNRLKAYKQFDGQMYPMTRLNEFEEGKDYRLTTYCSGERRALSLVNENGQESIKMSSKVSPERQLWNLKHLGNGKYQLTPKILGNSKALCGNVGQDKVELGASNSTWTIEFIRDTDYSITNMINGKEQRLAYNRDKKDLSFNGTSGGMLWEINEVGASRGNQPKASTGASTTTSPKIPSSSNSASAFNPDKYYRLTTNWLGEDKSLDIVNDAKRNKITMTKSGNYSGQAWRLEAIPNSGGYYRLTTDWLGKDICLAADKTNSGEFKLRMVSTSNSEAEYWKIEPSGNGYYRLTSKVIGSGHSLDIINDATKDKLTMAKSGNYSGQAWRITELR